MDKIKEETMIAVCGPVDAGKSSLIGVLTSGELDNGRGDARCKILRHPHERESGRTSNISLNPIIYKTRNDKIYLSNIINNHERKVEIGIRDKDLNNYRTDEKVISLIDLAGHEKYLKTTVYGVTGLFPDYGIVVIGANTGITKLTKEHLGILLYLKIPIIIVITKIDMAPQEIYQKLCNKIKKLLKKKTFGKVLYFISDSKKKYDETNHYIDNMLGNPDVIPIISLSNKDGTNIDNMHKLLYCLPSRKNWNTEDIKGGLMYINGTYIVPGIGLVLSGTTKGKSIKVKDKMYIGPENGEFKEVIIRSIHNSTRENINELSKNVQGCVAIKFTNQKKTLERTQIKKGMVLIDNIDKWKDNVVRIFTAKITILHHSTTIRSGYSPLIHCGPIRQSATINVNEEKLLRSGDTCIAKFRFKYNSEFLEKNMIFFFRDGNTKGIGEILLLN